MVLTGDCLLVLHVVPYSSFNLATPLSITELETNWMRFPPLDRGQANHRYVNFDGFVVLFGSSNPVAKQLSYTQVFRSGIVEAVSAIGQGDGAVHASKIDKYCVIGAKRYVDALSTVDVDCPIVVLASLVGMQGRTIVSGIDNLAAPYGSQEIRENELH